MSSKFSSKIFGFVIEIIVNYFVSSETEIILEFALIH